MTSQQKQKTMKQLYNTFSNMFFEYHIRVESTKRTGGTTELSFYKVVFTPNNSGMESKQISYPMGNFMPEFSSNQYGLSRHGAYDKSIPTSQPIGWCYNHPIKQWAIINHSK